MVLISDCLACISLKKSNLSIPENLFFVILKIHLAD